MKLSSFRGIIEATFTDRMNIYRYQPKLNVDRTTDTELDPVSISTNEPCRLSFIKMENPRDKDVDSIPVIATPQLFFKVGSVIKAGDYIEVIRIGDSGESIITYKGNIGLPAVFVTHQEALFLDSGMI